MSCTPFPAPASDCPTLRLLSLSAEIGFAASLIVLALAVLALRGHWRVAACWGSGIVLGLGVVLALKWSMALGPERPHFPSGHVALAVTFYGGLALVLVRQELPALPWRPFLVLAILAAIALAEGISRMALTEHDWIDVSGGFAVGALGLALTGNPWAWPSIGGRDRLWLAGTLAVTLPFCWLLHPHVSPWIRHLAGV